MEDVLDVYQRPVDFKRPLVNLDEFCKQLLSETRKPIDARPGCAAKYDVEYVREGCVSAFMIAAPHLGVREVFVSESATRTAVDYATAVEYLVDVMFPEAEKIILIQDNLNTHRIASLYEAFEPSKAHRIANRLELHYTPKHGSWLNIAEIEISVLARTCLSGRIASADEFRRKIQANTSKRNQSPRPVDWHFTTADARTKLKRLYPSI